MKIQKKEEEHLRYTTLKDRKSNLIPNLLAFFGLCRGIYRQKRVLEDETRPRVDDRRVAPSYGRENVAIAAFPRPSQGLKSLVFGERFPSLLRPSWYTWFRVYSSGFSSDVRKGLGSMHLLEVLLLGLQEIRI